MLDFCEYPRYNNKALGDRVRRREPSMERWLSWSKAHDWKSCVPYKGTEGSNPSLSAKNPKDYSFGFFFLSSLSLLNMKRNNGEYP